MLTPERIEEICTAIQAQFAAGSVDEAANYDLMIARAVEATAEARALVIELANAVEDGLPHGQACAVNCGGTRCDCRKHWLTKKARAWLGEAQKGDGPRLAERVPMFYTVFCLADHQGAPLALPQYSHQHEAGVLDLVLAGARREGFQGTAQERMTALGWRVGPVFA